MIELITAIILQGYVDSSDLQARIDSVRLAASVMKQTHCNITPTISLECYLKAKSPKQRRYFLRQMYFSGEYEWKFLKILEKLSKIEGLI